MKKVIQFGAGKIGRGFLGELFYRSGYGTVFVDVDRELISKINLHRTYKIKILKAGFSEQGNDPSGLIEVKNITGINAEDTDLVTDALAGVQLAATAVGAGALKPVSSLIALGIKKRAGLKIRKPLDIIICENLPNPAVTLRNYIFEFLNDEIREYAGKYLGLVESVVSRMVPDITANKGHGRGMLIEAEEYGCLPVAKSSFKGPIPEITGMIPHDNLEALVERKLFMHNAGHALCSYWGYLKGYRYVFEAVRDRVLRKRLLEAMVESADALCRKHGFTQAENGEYGEDLVRRFDNEGLKDTVERGARDPARKLGHDERLVGAANLAFEYGIVPRNLALGIAAAIRYDDGRDKTTAEIMKKLDKGGIDLVLKNVCALDPDGELACLIKKSDKELNELLGIK